MNRIQRSMLILPINVTRFVEKAYTRGADAIVLDMEDSVPMSEKEKARTLAKEALRLAGRGGADVLVRVNSDPDLLDADLDAAVQPGIHGIFLPKVESPEDVLHVEDEISRLETAHRLEAGRVAVSVHIESPRGVLNLDSILSASYRIESVSLGPDDYCLELGTEPSKQGEELLWAFCMMVNAGRAHGMSPMGILGSVAEFQDLASFEASAVKGRRLGSSGAYCIHPGQVEILNRVFSPSAEAVAYAERVVDAFEESMKQGRASLSLDGRMVDTPVYRRAKITLERARAISEKEREKAEALARM
ncbi:MAG: CoA ester lyase [Pseudomonadota bacterium]